MSDIPPDVIREFLCRIPVKSLLKLRCVHKSWKDIIDSPTFKKMQLKWSENNPKLILCGNSCWTQVSFDVLDAHTRTHDFSGMATLRYPADYSVVLGNCNGLLLITCGIDCVLWNPSTCMYIKLPYLDGKKPELPDAFHYHGGFGYDASTDDYKVLRIMQVAGDDESPPQTVLYSLKSPSLRRIEDFPVLTLQPKFGVSLFGALHWIVFRCTTMDYGYVIVTFDLEKEKYGEVPMPLGFGAGAFNDVCLGVFDGCLSLSRNFKCKRNDIWLLKDPKDGDSWAKKFSFEVDANWSFRGIVRPISYSKCMKYVILEKDEEQLICYDRELKTMRKHPLINGPDEPKHLHIFMFSESLVGVVDESKKMNQARKKRKTRKSDGFLSSGFSLKL